MFALFVYIYINYDSLWTIPLFFTRWKESIFYLCRGKISLSKYSLSKVLQNKLLIVDVIRSNIISITHHIPRLLLQVVERLMFRKVELTKWSEIRDVVALILNTKCCINIACNLQITIICQNMKGVKRWNLRKSFVSIIYIYSRFNYHLLNINDTWYREAKFENMINI